jgi:hypothetical protein
MNTPSGRNYAISYIARRFQARFGSTHSHDGHAPHIKEKDGPWNYARPVPTLPENYSGINWRAFADLQVYEQLTLVYFVAIPLACKLTSWITSSKATSD